MFLIKNTHTTHTFLTSLLSKPALHPSLFLPSNHFTTSTSILYAKAPPPKGGSKKKSDDDEEDDDEDGGATLKLGQRSGYRKKNKEKERRRQKRQESTDILDLDADYDRDVEFLGKFFNPTLGKPRRTVDEWREKEKMSDMRQRMCLMRDKRIKGEMQHRLRLRKLAILELPEDLREKALRMDLYDMEPGMLVPQIDPPREDIDIFGEFQENLLLDSRENDPLHDFGQFNISFGAKGKLRKRKKVTWAMKRQPETKFPPHYQIPGSKKANKVIQANERKQMKKQSVQDRSVEQVQQEQEEEEGDWDDLDSIDFPEDDIDTTKRTKPKEDEGKKKK